MSYARLLSTCLVIALTAFGIAHAHDGCGTAKARSASSVRCCKAKATDTGAQSQTSDLHRAPANSHTESASVLNDSEADAHCDADKEESCCQKAEKASAEKSHECCQRKAEARSEHAQPQR